MLQQTLASKCLSLESASKCTDGRQGHTAALSLIFCGTSVRISVVEGLTHIPTVAMEGFTSLHLLKPFVACSPTGGMLARVRCIYLFNFETGFSLWPRLAWSSLCNTGYSQI